jgi:hypothetical protein
LPYVKMNETTDLLYNYTANEILRIYVYKILVYRAAVTICVW